MWHISITYKILYKLSQYNAIPTVIKTFDFMMMSFAQHLFHILLFEWFCL